MWLIKDVYFPISEYLDNKEKIHLTMTSKEMDKLKYIFLYKDKIEIDLIVNLPYYDNFENVASSYISTAPFGVSKSLIMLLKKGRYPKNMQYHHYTTNVTYFFLHSLDFVPNATLIKCGWFGIEYFFENVPYIVTHLTFVNFNDPIIGVIPSSVTHLNLGNDFSQPITNHIPPSVTHLTFGNNFDHKLTRNSIPTSVIDLRLGYRYMHSIHESILRQVSRLEYVDS